MMATAPKANRMQNANRLASFAVASLVEYPSRNTPNAINVVASAFILKILGPGSDVVILDHSNR